MASIFFSWQADTPNRVGRSFLRPILEEVCAEISADAAVDEAVRVDSDTQGVAGQPPIAETILKKIDQSAVFVADMTFTGARSDGRLTPNPNVLIEYGWALKSLGHSRVICVMNTACGEPSRESLPFDLAHLRWPIGFHLAEDASPEAKVKEKKKLTKILGEAIRASLNTITPSQSKSSLEFKEILTRDTPGRFRGTGEAIGFEEGRFGGQTREVFLSEGAAMWLRIMPSVDPGKHWTTRELKEKSSSHLLPLIHPPGGYSYLRASDGIAMYWAGARERSTSQPNALLANSLAFAFRSGEIWSIDTQLLTNAPDRLFVVEMERDFTEGADNYRRFLQELGVVPPYRWKAGIVGAQGRRLVYPARPGRQWIEPGLGPLCATDLIEGEGLLVEHESTTSALLSLFAKVFEECDIERPDYLPQ